MLLAQYLVCGSFVPSAGLLGNYVGGLSGGSALKDLLARDFSSEISSGEEYVHQHYGGSISDEGEKNLDDETFEGKHDLSEDIHDIKDHSDFSLEHEHQHEDEHQNSPESHQPESEYEDSHLESIVPDIPEHHFSHDHEEHQDHDDDKSSNYEPNESKMLNHPALDFDSSESVKKIYHGKGGYSYSTLYENE